MKGNAPRPDDPVGKDTLDRFSSAKQFNAWLFRQIQPWCQGRVLEVGSGIGNLSEYFMREKFSTTLSDGNEQYCSLLKRRFADNPFFAGAYSIDLAAEDFEDRYKEFLGCFDSIVALNVIEHIEDDRLAISNCRKMLNKNGRLIVLVPAVTQLYNSLDKALGHFRRYDKKSLQAIHAANGIETLHMQYFNFAAIPGWWFSGAILHSKIIPQSLLNVYNFMVRVAKFLDYLVFRKIGISVIHVGSPAQPILKSMVT